MIVILGAGLTGLAAALRLEAAGAAYALHEKAAAVGGHATTTEEHGYRFDRTGHLLHLKDPDLRQEVLGWLKDDPVVAIERRSQVWSHGVLTPYPFQAHTHGLPAEVALECVQSFVEAHLVEARNPQRPPPTTFEDYSERHFGKGFTKYFLVPYTCRQLGVHPRELSVDWCRDFVPRPELEDVLRGALGLPVRALGYNTHFVYPRRGIGVLPTAMARRLPASRLITSHGAVAIDGRRRRVTFPDGEVPYTTLISSLPLPALVALLVDTPEPVRRAAEVLRGRDLWYLDVALRVPAGLDAHWVYVPEERYPFYRVGAYSNFSDGVVPAGTGSLYVELVSRDRPRLDEIWPQVVRGLTAMGWVGRPEDVAFVRLRHLSPAYVVYDAGRGPARRVVLDHLRTLGIQSTGRYGDWNYSSMEDALHFGRAAADAALGATS